MAAPAPVYYAPHPMYVAPLPPPPAAYYYPSPAPVYRAPRVIYVERDKQWQAGSGARHSHRYERYGR